MEGNILLSDELLPFPAQPVIRDDFINLFQFSKISRPYLAELAAVRHQYLLQG